jgi:6-phosphofructokinase 2
MAEIVTLTMNPAIDTYLSGESFRSAKIRCRITGSGPGGGGVNVARAIRKLGGVAMAALTAGGPSGQRLLAMLDERDVPHREIWVKGETRDTYVVFERESKRRYHIIIDGPRLHAAEWKAALALVGDMAHGDLILVLSGSLPAGVPDDFYAWAAAIAKRSGCRVALDTSGLPLVAALAEGVWLAKPNRNELETLAGSALPTFEDRRRAVDDLVLSGRAEVVAATFGPDGSLIRSSTEAWLAQAPPIKPKSEVGAGDSFLGAMILALCRGSGLREATAFAVAAAGSALSRSGPGLSEQTQTERLYAKVLSGEGVLPLIR